MKRILVVHTGGGLGDVLLSTPLLDALRGAWPAAEIDVLARSGTAPVLEGHPAVHRLLRLPQATPSPGELPGWVARLRRRRYQAGLVLWSRTALAWMLFLAGIPIRVGQDSRLSYSWLYTHKVRIRSEHGDTSSHWTEILLDYARALGVNPEEFGPARPRFMVPEEARNRAEELLGGLPPGDGPVVGLHPSKGLPLPPGRWPVEVFAGWARALHRDLKARLVLTGGPDEVDLVGAVARLAEVESLNLAGRTDLATLAAVASRCEVFVCPDSGPMHLAAAVGVPTVGVYALDEDFPQRWAPLAPARRILRPARRSCPAGCRKATCPDFHCYHAVPPEEVVGAVAGLLGARPRPAPEDPSPT